MKNSKAAAIVRRPERWQVRAGDSSMARLDIPADARHERTFEISFSMTVRPDDNAVSPWHEMQVHADGELQWARRVKTQHPAAFDGLEYRFRRRIETRQTLRLQVWVDCAEASLLRLEIEADEVGE